MWATGKKVAGGFTSFLKATFFEGGNVLHDTWTKMEFKGVAYDNDSEVDIVTNYRWDVAATGVYHICAVVSINTMPTTIALGTLTKIYKNGSTLERGQQSHKSGSSDGLTTSVHITSLALTAGDYIEVLVHQNSGVTKAINSQANYMTAERIG